MQRIVPKGMSLSMLLDCSTPICEQFNPSLLQSMCVCENYPMFLTVESSQEHVFTLSSGYVKDIKNTLFSLTRSEMKEVLRNVLAKQPKPLTSQFEGRISKEEAIEKRQTRHLMKTVLHPPGEINI